MRIMRSSRGVREASVRVVVSRRFDWIAASIAGRLIEAKALRKLRHPSRSRILRSFLDN